MAIYENLVPHPLRNAEVCISSNLLVVSFGHYRSRLVCRVPKAHGKGRKTHSKRFAVCNTRQNTHGIQLSAKDPFAV